METRALSFVSSNQPPQTSTSSLATSNPNMQGQFTFTSRVEPPTTSTLSSAKLPTEICEYIIDFIGAEHHSPFHPNRNAALCACTLTCRAFNSRARFHLYTDVYIQMDRIDALFNSLTLCPTLGPLVRSLNLSHKRQHPGYEHPTSFSQLPSLLPGLSSLSFSEMNFLVTAYPSPLSFAEDLSLFKGIDSLTILQNVTFNTSLQL